MQTKDNPYATVLVQAEAHLQIDKSALDEMVIRQPVLYHRYAEMHAEAVSRRDALKERLTVVRAECDLKIRKNGLEGYDGKKPTEAAISSQIDLDSEYRQAMEEYGEARLAAERCLALKDAFAQRAYMLRDLVQLFVAGYWSDGCVAPRTDSEHEAVRRRINMKRNETK